MVHLNRTTSTSNVPQGASQSRTGKANAVSRKGIETHGKKTCRSFFSKTAAMLFVVSAYIFLKHQDDIGTNSTAASTLQAMNNVARNLAGTIEEAAPSEEELELEQTELPQGEDAEEPLYSDQQLEEREKEDDYGQEEEAIPEERTPEEQEEQEVQEEVHYDGEGNIKHDSKEEDIHESIESFDIPQEPIVQAQKEAAQYKTQFFRGQTYVPSGKTRTPEGETTEESDDKVVYTRPYMLSSDISPVILQTLKTFRAIYELETPQMEYSNWQKLVYKHAGYRKEEYENLLKQHNTRPSKYNEQDHTHKRDELLSGDSRPSDRHEDYSSIAFNYEMSCFDERLTDSDIDEKLGQIEEEPHKSELLSLYWQSYRNERHKYGDLKKSLLNTFLQLQKKQNVATIQIYNDKWSECEDIFYNNLTKQNEHVNSVFRTMLAKEKLSTYEFEEILYDIRESWKEMALKTTNECIAFLKEPIYLEAVYVKEDPYYMRKGISGFIPVGPAQ
ncbi:hypothetical protein AK88_04306 [Plasmodium fragile]|uniref:Plasmodium RESA N-terminal domain-containing protein n=1 Tax=Plasmodium fragile TaxID=5857 RepID=A0A0D9QGA2_PLAFR|nr:uncharacterized protein AK88_04306 [Plasmodium fragile]KJP86049.1 hypothetical protein AK88_04306 [Plasmodium fragile]